MSKQIYSETSLFHPLKPPNVPLTTMHKPGMDFMLCILHQKAAILASCPCHQLTELWSDLWPDNHSIATAFIASYYELCSNKTTVKIINEIGFYNRRQSNLTAIQLLCWNYLSERVGRNGPIYDHLSVVCLKTKNSKSTIAKCRTCADTAVEVSARAKRSCLCFPVDPLSRQPYRLPQNAPGTRTKSGEIMRLHCTNVLKAISATSSQ